MKITMGNRSTLIIKREDGKEYDNIVKIISSTEPQPFYGINFDGDRVIGGRTMNQMEVDSLISAAKKANAKIEE